MTEANYMYFFIGLPLIILYLSKKYWKKVPKGIDEKLLVQRLKEFSPEPMINPELYSKIPELIEITAEDDFTDFATGNFLNIYNHKEQKTKAEQCIRQYGVGSCGPRGFYGTMDIHLEVEERLAKFMNLEETVLYSYGYSTVSSAIPAYCRKADIIFSDEEISFCAKQGYVAARSNIVYFKHNDVVDLEEKLEKCLGMEKKLKCTFRKFLVVEGLYQSTGQICPLPELMILREKYKLRMFLDESASIGVLGKTGRGVSEHFKVDRTDIDMIMGSLEYSFGSIGGFCVGSSVVIEHQRLSGLGYCFSASLPPFLCQSAIYALDVIEKRPDQLSKLREISLYAHEVFSNIPGYILLSDPISPIKILEINLLKPDNNDATMKAILDQLYDGKISYTVVLDQKRICLKVKITHTEDDIQRAAQLLAEARNDLSHY